MNRLELLDTLKIVAPALSNRDIVPIFASFCFDGARVFAYDDLVALEAPLEVPIKGAIRGEFLLKLLSAIKSKKIEVLGKEGDDTVVILKAGRTRAKLALLPPDQFQFEFPKEKADELPLDEKFYSAVKRARVSMGSDPSHPWRCGITVAFKKEATLFYSSDNKAGTRITSPIKAPKAYRGKVLLLPPKFCDSVVNMWDKDQGKLLRFTADWVECQFKSGVRLLSRMMENRDTKWYDKVFADTVDSDTTPKAISIPKGFSNALERAIVVTPYMTAKLTQLSVEAVKGEHHLLLMSRSPVGDVRDRLSIDEHPAASEHLDPELVLRILPYVDRLCIIENHCVVLRSKGFAHLITVDTDKK